MTADTGDLEQVRQRLAALKRLASAKQQAAVRDRWLRRLGHITRPAAYLGPVVVLFLWLWPDGMFSQSIATASLEDLFRMSCAVLLLSLLGVPMLLLSLNVDQDEIEWKAWGRRFGLWPLTILAAAVVLLD